MKNDGLRAKPALGQAVADSMQQLDMALRATFWQKYLPLRMAQCGLARGFDVVS